MELIRMSEAIAETVDAVGALAGRRPLTVATCARRHPRATGFAALRRGLAEGGPHLLLLGTAWGLAETVIESADRILEPIEGAGGYNHLSVRSAAAIVFDRLLGRTG
jgi:hypothetical protein